jgi:riboflavin synthase
MFTGIIQSQGSITQKHEQGDMLVLHIHAPEFFHQNAIIGESIAHNGVCLTLIDWDMVTDSYRVAISPETLACTVGLDNVGSVLNLERALRAEDRLGGHYVSGHVDGIGEIIDRNDLDDWVLMRIQHDSTLSKFMAKKGSIAVNGVSLTVNEIGKDWFEIGLIPHTMDVTNLKFLRVGSKVNLEIDLIARYVARMLAYQVTQENSVTV